jgi:RecB family exonuclease
MIKSILSHSAVSLYQQCSYCYYLKYIEHIRPKVQNSALFFGKALDDSFNILLLERSLGKALEHFVTAWTKLQDTPMKFRKNEVDIDLINHFPSMNEIITNPEWETLFQKGILFINTYYDKVLPKIKEVIAVQEPFGFKNADGDEIKGIIDLIVKWEDGKIYLLDNKTSSYSYAWDSARTSPQLTLYDYVVNEKYKLDGIGYIVLDKNIKKNKILTCKDCGGTTTNSRLKTCAQDLGIDGHRCNGQFSIQINPSVNISYIFDTVDKKFQDKIIQQFDDANNGICNEIFAKKHNPKFGPYGPCEYYYYTPSNKDFYKKEKKVKEINSDIDTSKLFTK